MWRAMLLGVAAATGVWGACKCQMNFSACQEAANSEVIFVGTVESIQPSFLDPWNPSQATFLALINQQFAESGFPKLREAYLKVFPDLPADQKKRLETATTKSDLSKLFYRILDHGKRVRLRVRTLYRNGDDDVDGDDAPKILDVWTAFGECGVHFQIGETYLVYGDADEESDIITTDACSRTRRLSEAGDDLTYLYYRKNFGDEAARVEGFVTSDLLYQKTWTPAHYSDRIFSPVPGVVVQLKGADRTRHAETDERGRFVFDGVPEGEYTLSCFAAGYPEMKKEVTASREVRVEKKACAIEVLVKAGEPR
jgi:hypothetical protein